MVFPIQLCIVEDDPDIRNLTKEILELDHKILVTNMFSNGEDFIESLSFLNVDLVLMDIGLPKMSGTECVRLCNFKNIKLDFIMYTTHFDAHDVFDALKAGAKGYILKGGNPEKLIEDIYEMAEGGSPMSPQISRLVTNSFNKIGQDSKDLKKLTKQEWEVLKALDKGLNYREIAAERFVSAHTVRAQIRSIYEKLHVHSKLEAINKIRNSNEG